jgi:hypothetical protein
MSPRCPRQAGRHATSWRPRGARRGPSSSPPWRVPAPAVPPSDQRQRPATQTLPYDADHGPGAPAARYEQWQQPSRPNASSSIPAAGRLPALRTARHPASFSHSIGPRSAPDRPPGAQFAPDGSSACPQREHRRRYWPAPHGATAVQDRERYPVADLEARHLAPAQASRCQHRHQVTVAAPACFRQRPQLFGGERMSLPASPAAGWLGNCRRHVVLYASIGHSEGEDRPQPLPRWATGGPCACAVRLRGRG